MKRPDNNLIFFLIFFGITFFIIISGELGVLGGTQRFISDLSWRVSSFFAISKTHNTQLGKLAEENMVLRKQQLDNQSLVTENKALQDQFAVKSISSQTLIPAKVVGMPGFIPGVSNPDYLIINKGISDGIKLNSTVVYQNNFVGKVVGLSNNYSKVQLEISLDSFTAKVEGGKEISGVIKGKGNILILDNVLVSETLGKGWVVLTKGDINEHGEGILPDLVIGKIISIDKKSSDLFQRAEVESFLDFKNLSTVFIAR